jgi:hypothetical protein
MSAQSVEVVHAVYDACGRGDVPAVLGLFADDIAWHEPEGLPYGGVHNGPMAVAQNVFGPVTEDVEGFAVTPEEVFVDGDRVAVVARYSGTGRVTRRVLELGVVHVWDVRDGRITRFRQYLDTMRFLEVVPLEVSVVATAAR